MPNQPAARSVDFVITRILELIAFLFAQLPLLICQLANLISEFTPKTAVTASYSDALCAYNIHREITFKTHKASE